MSRDDRVARYKAGVATVTVPSSDQEERDELARLTDKLRALQNEKQEWLEERQALIAKIHQLTALVTGRLAQQPTTEARLLHVPVDAGATPAEAESKQEQRERREAERDARKRAKNRKKGKGPDGKTKPVNGGGRRPVNPALTPVEMKLMVPAAQRTLPDGTPLITLRWERRELEQSVPAGLVRLVYLTEVMGTSDTHEYVVRAPTPPAIQPRGKYHDSLIIEMMVRKYMRGMPFYRVLQDVRAMGSDLSDATLSDLARAFAACIRPLAQAIRSQVLAEMVAHIDETPLPTQDGGRYLWAILGGRQVFFHVGGRGGNELRLILGLPLEDPTPGERARIARATDRVWKFAHMMADGYSVYDTVLTEAGIDRMNCWAHGLRDLEPFEADPVIGRIVKAIQGLYGIERHAAKEVERDALEGEAAIAIYARLRAKKAIPQLGIISGLLSGARDAYTKGSKQRKAIDFLRDHWPTFTAYAQRGDLPIDNNDAERALRMIVVGRKNWMLIGSEDAAPHAAEIYTVMESCRLCKVEPRAYLTHVIARLLAQDTPAEQLTPRSLADQFPLRE
jgi:transposase